MTPEPSGLPDLSQCAREPIHIPGAIQPHGVLLALDPSTLVARQASDNVEAVLRVPLARLLDSPLETCLGAEQTARLRQVFAGPTPQALNPMHLQVDGVAFDGLLHRVDGLCVLELEPRSIAPAELDEGALQRLLGRLAASDAMPKLLDTLTRTIRELTGFDRVLVYRFDEDEHGEVVSESRSDEVEPYLGLHYPESDIPRQARELYRRNWIRSIPNAVYTPARLVPPLRPDSGAPLDLSQSLLRSVSPVHLEYLANMGVQASLSVSLIVDDRLWGLISCGHRQPHFTAYRLRSLCETIGRIASLQIAALQAIELRREQDAGMGAVQRLAASMRAAGDDVLEGLLADDAALLALTGAAGAALFTERGVVLRGRTPAHDDAVSLGSWVRERCDEHGVFHTHQLGADDPSWARVSRQASGVLAFLMPAPEPRGVLWFRPEQVQTVQWGGDPSKTVQAEPEPAAPRLHPRRSFELWKEEVRDRSLRWEAGALHAATQLRRHALELDLMRQVARERAAVQARDDLVAVVSHDLRNPMSVVVMQAVLLQRLLAENVTEASQRMLASAQTIQRAGQRMAGLLVDLLELAKIEAGRYEVAPRPMAAADILRDTWELLESLGHARQITLACEPAPDLTVRADAERLFQVFSNLIGNAVKHAPERSIVRLGACRAGDRCEFWVADQGPGLDATQLPHLFDRYWQARRSDRSGAGLGLYIAKGIVEAHGGSIRAENAQDRGAVFRFTLPLA